MNPQLLSSFRGPYAGLILSLLTIFLFNRFYKHAIYSVERSNDLEFIFQNVHLWTILLMVLVVMTFFAFNR